VNNVAQDWNKWWAAVNMVMYFPVPQNVGNFSSSWKNILLHELVMLLNVYNSKDQFITVRWIFAFCFSIWNHKLFTIFHNKTDIFLLDWGTILVCVKQQYQKHPTYCTCKYTTVKKATITSNNGKCILHYQCSTETTVETFQWICPAS
jgi:hypothetical protein